MQKPHPVAIELHQINSYNLLVVSTDTQITVFCDKRVQWCFIIQPVSLIFFVVFFCHLILGREFQEDIKYRFLREKTSPHNIEDVYDGHLYKKLFENNGPLSQPENLSLKFNTDGVSIFKSSGSSIWPVYFEINELPPSKR